jgi:hypothetical protein
MASSGPLSAGLGADDSGTGTLAWTTPNNVLSLNASYATRGLAAGSISHYIKATQFGFAIPATATVLGISADVNRAQNQATTVINDEKVRVVKGGVIGSTDRANATTWPTTDTYVTYGSASDLWGDTWTAADINASTFGFAISAKFVSGVTTTSRVDHIRMTVTYAYGGVVYRQNRSLRIR